MPQQVQKKKAQNKTKASLSSTLQLALLAVIGLAVAIAVPVFLTNTTLAWLERTVSLSAFFCVLQLLN